jgi:ferredoxin-NADP reductase
MLGAALKLARTGEQRKKMADQKAPIGSLDPRLPPPLPLAAPKEWAPRSGNVPTEKPQTYTATFDEILQPTPDVRLFRLTLDGYSTIFPFVAGQFIQFLCPVPDPEKPGKTKKLIRSYSIASPPEEKRFLEFCIKLVMEGGFTPTLWDKRVGDKIEMRGPYGKFVVSEPLQHDVVFIAAGTGIAPFWGMIYHLLKGSHVKRDLLLLFGVRYEEDLVYVDEFKKLAAEFPNFRPVFTLSRPRHPETWWGEKGYVQTLLPRYVKDPKNTKAFICGLTPMIEQSVVELERIGVTSDRIHYERYD